MRCTVRRRTERRTTRRCCDHEVVQGSSHRFEAPTPQIGKLLLVGSGTGSAEARQVPAHAARERRARVCAIMAGLLPIMWSHGAGAEVMQRIAVPMIGGMVSSTLLTLIVIPAIYAVVKGVTIVAVPALTPRSGELSQEGT